MANYRVEVYCGNNLASRSEVEAADENDAAEQGKAVLPYTDTANYRTAVTALDTPAEATPAETAQAESEAAKLVHSLEGLPADVVDYIKSLENKLWIKSASLSRCFSSAVSWS